MGQISDLCKDQRTHSLPEHQIRSPDRALFKQPLQLVAHTPNEHHQHEIPVNVSNSQAQKLIQSDYEAKYLEMRQKEQQFEKAKEEASQKLLQLHKKQHTDKLQQWLGFMVNKFERCLYFYDEHDVDSAHEYIVEIRDLSKEIMEKQAIDEQHLSIKYDDYLKQKGKKDAKIVSYKEMKHKLQRIELEYTDIISYEQVITKTAWQLRQDQNGKRTSTKKQEKSIGVLIELELNVQFQKFIAILIEINLFHEFVPFVESSKELKEYGRNMRTGYGIVNMPIITRRQYYFQGILYDRLKHTGELFMYVRSIHDKPDIQKILQFFPQLNKDYVPLDYRYFVLKYKPIRKGVGQIKFALNVDIGVNFLPEFIEEIVIKKFANDFFANILEKSKKFENSLWQQSVKKRPQPFDFFRLRISDYVHHLQQQQKQQKLKK